MFGDEDDEEEDRVYSRSVYLHHCFMRVMEEWEKPEYVGPTIRRRLHSPVLRERILSLTDELSNVGNTRTVTLDMVQILISRHQLLLSVIFENTV